MTMPSRGISPIQKKAKGVDMKKKGPKRPPKLDSVSVGAASGDMPEALGLRPGMKKGGACKGYYKGGSVDGCVKKGHTRGKLT